MKYVKAAALAVMLSLAAAASADTFNVTNTADSGPGSLRDAITLANATPGDDIVRFTVPGLLKPATPYPATVGKIMIDSTIPPTIHAIPPVEIDASALSAPVFHLSSGSSLWGFTIHGDQAAAVEAGDGAWVFKCFIGTDGSGSTPMPNATGILVTGGGARLVSNLISGNTIGVEMTATAGGTSIYDNRIGLSNSGTYAIPNGVGVNVNGNASSTGLEIGILGLPNAISGNTGAAIRIASFNSVTITGNYIGTADYTGKAMGNGGGGIELSGSSNCSIKENVIANNTGTAIWIGGGAGAQNHNLISKNTIIRNGFGIDLGDTRNGHTANDSLDGDNGPNGFLNHPVITLAIDNNTAPTPTATVTGTFSSAPNSPYAIELFVSANCLSGDYGAADTYLTTLDVTTDGNGNASFSQTFGSVLPGMGLSATATDAQNNTSELSNCVVVTTHGKFRFAENAPVAVAETGGSLVVTVMRVGGSAGTTTVHYATSTATQAGFYSATAGLDYAPASGTLTFADGETSKTFTISIFDDKMYETNEIFDMTLSNPTGGAILDYPPTLRGYILDDETQSKISIADTPVTEGNSGTTLAHVPVTINPPAGFPVTVTFAVGSGESATAGEDYKPFSGSLTFQPGEGTKTIDVPIVADTNYELNEVFGVALLAATPAQDVLITNYGAHVTIVNDDIGKVLCTPSVSVPEGPSGALTAVEITCTPDSPFAGGVHYITANGTAGYDDYKFSSGSIVFNPGIYFGQQKFTVPIVGDDTIEPNEQFTINLHAEPAEGWNFVVEPAVITVTILNDDTPGVVRCTDGFATEGNGGSKDVTITCTSPTRIAGTIDYATADGTATAADYGKVSGTLTFEDEAVKSFTVPVFGDKEVEPDEQFTVHFTAHPSTRLPFTMDRDSVVVTIMNDDEEAPRGNLVLAPPHVVVTVGDTAQVRAMIEPPFGDPVTLAIVTLDPSIADVPSAVIVAPHQPAFITVKAKKRGTTAATVSAGADLVAVLFIDVTDGPPKLNSLSPAAGPTLGGAVALHGENLASNCTTWFGGIQASSAVVNNATTATVVAPPHAAGSVDVALSCGSATTTLPQAFTYVPVPVRGRAARH